MVLLLLCDSWSRKLVPRSQLIRLKTDTNHDLVTCVLLRFRRFAFAVGITLVLALRHSIEKRSNLSSTSKDLNPIQELFGERDNPMLTFNKHWTFFLGSSVPQQINKNIFRICFLQVYHLLIDFSSSHNIPCPFN